MSENFNYETKGRDMGKDYESSGKSYGSSGKSYGSSGSHYHHYNRTGLIVGLSVAGAVILFIILYFSLRK